MPALVHELLEHTASKRPDAEALRFHDRSMPYSDLASAVQNVATSFVHFGIRRSERIAVYLDKRPETVVALFAASAAGAVFVPVNPLLRPEQVAYILKDCNVRILVTSGERLQVLREILPDCRDLHTVVVAESDVTDFELPEVSVRPWNELLGDPRSWKSHRVIDGDMAAILYTSGSTGKPKGVVLSHRNIVAGAESVVAYLENQPTDRILTVLPFSFDYGLSQLTTSFLSGACAVLINYLLPRDIVLACEKERITGLAAVPPLWIQLARLDWPQAVSENLRYITNSGGAMPRSVVQILRSKFPRTKVFLMYGLTEAFRSTYLPPAEIDKRPDSIGRAIPNAEIRVVRADGSPCAPGEPGELVHRGGLVAMGYWNDPVKTAERFRPEPAQDPGITVPQIAVWSGDTVRMDTDGYLYFVGRSDDMIKTSGYRVSPTEIEEIVYSTGLVGEAVALGVPHPVLGQAVVLVRTPPAHGDVSDDEILAECRRRLPAYMVPALVETRNSLPRNPNGKIDRKRLAHELETIFQES